MSQRSLSAGRSVDSSARRLEAGFVQVYRDVPVRGDGGRAAERVSRNSGDRHEGVHQQDDRRG